MGKRLKGRKGLKGRGARGRKRLRVVELMVESSDPEGGRDVVEGVLTGFGAFLGQ